jgi:hypothetical protein
MKIRAIADPDLGEYDALAREHGTVFDSLAWTDLYLDHATRYGVFQDNGDLIGGFCLYRQSRFGSTVLRNSPFTPHCGPFFLTRARNPVALLEERRGVIEAMAKFLDEEAPAIVLLALAPVIRDALPFYWAQFKVVPNYTYELDLSVSLDQIRMNMSAGRRNDVSKARRDGLTVRLTRENGVVRDLVLATFSRQVKKVSEAHLSAILFRFSNERNSYAFTTYRGDCAIATSFVVHDARTAYYLLGGYRADEKHHGAGALALFEAIAHAKAIGLRTFDFEGSVIPQIERHFRGFGGTLVPYYTVNKAWLPLEMGLKFLRRAAF